MKKHQNMTVWQAVQLTVDAAGGAKPLSELMEIGHQVFLNKVNPNNTTHHLYLADAVRMMRLTGDTRILEALANEFGGIYVPVEVPSGVSPNLAGDLATMSAEFGDLMREVAGDLSDGAISDNELERVEREADGLRNALYVLLSHLRRLNKESRPRELEEANTSRK